MKVKMKEVFVLFRWKVTKTKMKQYKEKFVMFDNAPSSKK